VPGQFGRPTSRAVDEDVEVLLMLLELIDECGDVLLARDAALDPAERGACGAARVSINLVGLETDGTTDGVIEPAEGASALASSNSRTVSSSAGSRRPVM
jgi:hypothetical protein